MSRFERSNESPALSRWALALGAILSAMAARALLDPWLGHLAPFLFALPAIFAIGLWLGIRPALMAVALSVLWVVAPVLPPTLSAEEGWRTCLYFLPSGLVLGFLGARLGRPPATAEESELEQEAWIAARLHAALVLAVAVPVVMFAVAALKLLQQASDEAAAEVAHAARVGEEHALKVFETNIALINRITDLMGDDSDPALLAREPELHEKLKRMGAGLPQLQGIFLIDSGGHMVATNRVFPAPHDTDFSDRASFAHHRAGGAQPFISGVLTSRTTGEPFFDMSVRRTRADGSFGGTVSTSLAPKYFADFYRDIAGGRKGLAIELRGPADTLLAAWPPRPGDAQAATATTAATTDRLGHFASRTLGPYPVRVQAHVDRGAVLAPWYGQTVLLLAFAFPSAVGLVYAGWVAVRRTRRALAMAQALREETRSRQQVEETLRQAQKLEAMGRLTGGVAHDFNNVLMIIASNLHLHKRELGPDARTDRLAAMERAVTAGTNLTRQLLSFSRRQPLQPEVVRLQERLPGMMDMVRPALGAGVTLSHLVAADVPAIRVDVAELELAVLNLAINARDAMPGGGQLRIGAARSASLQGGREWVAISVQDTGQGIPAELRERVFEPFFTTKPAGLGTGLGLSQVHALCQRAGGMATLDSTPGVGTTISMLFPAIDDRDAGAAALPPGARHDAPLGLRVLLVEDHYEVAMATLALLQALGCTASRAVDADDALRRLLGKASQFDLVLSDIMMPGSLDGIDLAKRIRDIHPELGVVLMSGYADRIEMASDLAFAVVPKPCSPAAIAAACVQAMSHVGRHDAASVP